MASTKAHKKKQKSLNIPIRYISSLFFTATGAVILISTSFKNIDWFIKPQAQHTENSQAETLQKPVRIYIPQMHQILPVSDGYIKDDRWVTSQTGVSFYTNSALPGKGNTVIYGHNIAGILGGLWKVREGDYIYLITQNGNYVKYQINQRKEIDPSQVDILNSTNEPVLTLYTCSGFLDSARFVVVGQKVV